MKCCVCHDETARKRGEIDLRINGKLYLVRHVIYDECPSCGEKVLSPRVSQDLFDKIKKAEFVEETVTIPVLECTYG
jgi:YgiT-type zinc finger domain-containing protein